MYKAVIFDFGGVIHSSEHNATRDNIIAAINNTKIDKTTKQALYKEQVDELMISKIPDTEIWTKSFAKHNLEIPEKYDEAWIKGLRDDAQIYAEMLELADFLKKQGIKTYILTNTISAHAAVLKEKGWYDHFDKVFFSYELGLRKPDPAIYQHVLKDIGLLPSEVIFVDDLEENLLPAHNLGITTVLAQNPEQVAKDVKALVS